MSIQIGSYSQLTQRFLNYGVDLKLWKYPAGEVGVSTSLLTSIYDSVLARVQSSDDLMQLLLVAASMSEKRHLVMPYFPYARQDRRQDGMPCSLQIVADMIDNLGFEFLHIVDPHSAVLAAMFRKTKVVEASNHNLELEAEILRLKIPGTGKSLVLSPDIGAAKRAAGLAQRLEVPYELTFKSRDPKTGHLKIDRIGEISSEVESIFIMDDICDGGGTFGMLASKIREFSHANLILLVTHGIFSGNYLNNLAEYSHVVTTNSFKDDYQAEKKLFEAAGIDFRVVSAIR